MRDIKIGKVNERCFLEVGKEFIEISNYNLKSSADGTTELAVVIKGEANLFELSASLEELNI